MKCLLILLFLIFNITALISQTLTPQQIAAIDKVFLADIPDGGPGGGLSIVLDGEVVYTKYAGLADLDTQRAIDGDTRFNIASNAKQFTAIAVLKLVGGRNIEVRRDADGRVVELLVSDGRTRNLRFLKK
jgi:CubicO group peptidase (beta-lactamase class C family)